MFGFMNWVDNKAKIIAVKRFDRYLFVRGNPMGKRLQGYLLNL